MNTMDTLTTNKCQQVEKFGEDPQISYIYIYLLYKVGGFCMYVCMTVSPNTLERLAMDYSYQYNYCMASSMEGLRPIKSLKIEKNLP